MSTLLHSRRRCLRLLALAPLGPLASACSPRDASLGFQFEFPTGWHYVSSTEVEAYGQWVRFSPAELDAAITRKASTPLLAVVKYAPPHEGPNPSFGINVTRGEELRDRTSAQMLAAYVTEAQRAANNRFKLVDSDKDLTISGYKAAHAILAAPPPDLTLLGIHTLMMGQTSFMFVTQGPSDGPEMAEEAFSKMLTSFAFTRR